jgi:glycolate oxidase
VSSCFVAPNEVRQVRAAPVKTHGALVDDLRAALSPERVRDGATELSLYRRDASNMEGSTAVVCLATSTADVQACVLAANRHGVPFVARGSGTGLSGGAVPLDGAVVIATTRMNEVLAVDPANRQAWVEPGVLNLDLSRQVEADGLHFAPDPSSQQTCTIGGNIANNSGGPHCLAEGVTSSHIVAIEVVLPDGNVAVLGGEDPEPPGYDLRGAFVGSEGMCGIATAICVRLTQNPPVVRTMLLDFGAVEDGASTVSDIIAAGIVPAALEMMDQGILVALEEAFHFGFPLDAEAVLIIEVDGLEADLDAQRDRVAEICRAEGAREVRFAKDAKERLQLWKARKQAFGAIGRLSPSFCTQDGVVPRTKLPHILKRIREIGLRHDIRIVNVFHAGDGNLHPNILFDMRVPGELDRVVEAGAATLRACIELGGSITGEHGVGLEKKAYIGLLFNAADLEAMTRVRNAFDPDNRFNPAKLFPTPASCGEVRLQPASIPAGLWI